MRSASDHGLSPHIMPISISNGHLFCQFIFCCALRAFLSLSDCAEEPTIVSSYIGLSGRFPSRVWVQVTCRELYSPLPVVPICIALSISHSEEEGRVLVYPRKRLSRVLYAFLLTAPCRTLLLLSSYSRRGSAYYY